MIRPGKEHRHGSPWAAVVVPVPYSWVSGSVLLRVSRVLTPDQAAEYQKALDGIG